jgi:hypothetical protein
MTSKFAKKRQAILESEMDKKFRDIVSLEPQSEQIDFQEIAFNNRMDPEADPAAMIVSKQNQNELFTRHFRWIDARTLTPNSDNYFDIDEESIIALSDLILETGYTDPIIVRETEIDGKDAIEIIDGERRTRAHMHLGETVGEKWYMVPTRYYLKGELSDAESRYMLSAENLGQRSMSESNRAQAFAAVQDRIVERRMKGEDQEKGRVVERLAKQFNVSERTAQMNINIGKHLIDKGLRLMDERKITKSAADVISTLPVQEQEELLNLIEAGLIKKEDAEAAAREKSTTRSNAGRPKSKPTVDGYMAGAIKSLSNAYKKAVETSGKAQRTDIAKIRDLLELLDPDIKEEPEVD